MKLADENEENGLSKGKGELTKSCFFDVELIFVLEEDLELL